MSFQDIIKTIEKDAESKKEKMDKEKEEKISFLEKDYSQKINEKKEGILKSAKEKTDQVISETAWGMREKRKISTLKKKRELLEKVYKSAFEEISNLSESEHKNFFERLLNHINAEVKYAEIKIVSARKGKKIIEKIAESKNNLKISENCLDSKGGFIAKMDNKEINCGFEMIFNKIREKTELKVADRLFKEN